MTERTRRAPRERYGVDIGEKIPARGVGHWFTRFSERTASLMGNPWAFLVAVGMIILWSLTGPFFAFSSDWQLIVNTGTTVITFLMVFLIQNTQNRDAKAIHLKLDELLRATPRARKEFMEAEEEDLDEIVREKAIVDRADPAPPADRKQPDDAEAERRITEHHHGNGKTKHVL